MQFLTFDTIYDDNFALHIDMLMVNCTGQEGNDFDIAVCE